MKIKYSLFFVLISFLLNSSFDILAKSSYESFISSDFEPQINDNFKKEISDTIVYFMGKHNIPGLAISIVDRDSILWADAYGVKKIDSDDSINTETIFSLQSISKTVTSTAVMIAVQEGLVSLDTPIVCYIKDFSVNSKFEKEPEKKITLRHLLSHRAGFTHEAPIGNNYQPEFESFEQHIKSISNTWLKSEVGKLYSYSNLGMDLAGYIIQVKSGMKFEDYVKEKLFDPLNMKHTSFDWEEIREEKNRAIGNSTSFNKIPLEFAMIPAGACYTNVIDMAKFIQLHLNEGKHDGQVILDKKYIGEMYKIPFCKSDIGYALGVDISINNGVNEYNHSGGGFGFQTVIKWIPELNIGIAVLTNSASHNNIHKLIADIVINKLKPNSNEDLLNQSKKSFSDKVPITLTNDEYSRYTGLYLIEEGNQEFELLLKDSVFGAQGEMGIIPFKFTSNEGEFFISGISPEIDGEYRMVLNEITGKPLYIINKIDRPILYFNEREKVTGNLPDTNWNKYLGSYSRKMYDTFTTKHKINIKNGNLYFDMFRLEEYIPNLFYASNGEVLDFRGDMPTYRNILLFKDNGSDN